MDIFFEQLVKMKYDAKRVAAIVGIYLGGAALIWLIFTIAIGYGPFGMFVFIALIFPILYFTVMFASFFKVEYEYILTNGEVDIDKIVNKSRRRRVATFECSAVESMKKYNKNEASPANINKKIIAGNIEENTYSVIVKTKKGERIHLVFTPDEKMLEGFKKHLPRLIKMDIFGTI